VNLNKSNDTNEPSWWSKITGKHKKKEKRDIEDVIGQSKQILGGLSLDLEAGKVLAILGGSGSGKTTFLNTLASRMNFATKSDNPFKFDGMVEYAPSDPNISYMIQEDIFNPGLTVQETLEFTAKLRIPNTSKKERAHLIDFLFDSLGLSKVRHTRVCDFQYRTTLSGGERRRVSLAIQLLTKPQVLFLDEPTTGLDSNTSIHLVNTVKKLAADFGITVILTIHQPRFEILESVDEICVLAKGGNMIFTGTLQAGYEYFDHFKDSSDLDSNFADFLLRISSIDKTDSKEIEAATQKRVHQLISNWKTSQPLKPLNFINTFASGSPLIRTKHIEHLPLLGQIQVLFSRTVRLTLRDFESLIMLQVTMTILSVICGWLFLRPGGSLAGIRSTTSALYVCCEVLGFAPMMYEIQRLCMTEGKFLLRERKEGMYTIPAWFIGRRLAKMLMEDIPCTVIWSVVTYYMWGIESTSNFGIFYINNLLIYMIGIAVGHLCFVAGAYKFSTASLISALYYQLQNSACGYFVNAKTMPVYVRWTKYISNFWYNFGSLLSNNYSNYMGDCPYDSEEMCFEYSGTAVLKNLGFPKDWKLTPLMAAFGWFFGFYIASALWLWYETRRDSVKIVKERSSKFDQLKFTPLDPIETEVHLTKSFDDRITISLNGITLFVKPKVVLNKLLRRPFLSKDLLKDVSVEFRPGVNVIMGPSGSGKTTLLNMLTGRTASYLGFTGGMKLNGFDIPPQFLSKITSYVVQEDSVLIPTLTVRETLFFQARLRLDPSRHSQIPNIINELMRKMGLSDVANIPIGDAYTKGISGGEKRRVSIAIQLLNNSKILLLDEPTSGLDSFTSSSIVSLLDDLAKTENKTIIMTIHQPKFEMFEKFDNILLLGDGHVLYDGAPSDLISYFKGLDYEPEHNMNFADYMLDVVSKREEGEVSTMQRLISEWENRHVAEKDAIVSQYNTEPFEHLVKRTQSFSVCFKPVLERQFKVLMRSPDVLFCRIGQPCGVSVIHALFFSPLRNNSESIGNRLGLVQNVLNMYYVGFLNNMALYPNEKFTFYQEYQDGIYSTSTFMLCYFLNEIPFEIVCSFIFSIFIVLVIGLPRNAEMFFTMFYMTVLVINCGESIGIVFNTIFDHLGIATNILSNFLTIGIFMAGTMSINMPVFFKAFNYISPLKYAVLACAQLGFEGQTFTCVGGGYECTLDTGEAVLHQYKLTSNFAVDMGVIAAIFVVYRVIAVCTLQIKVKYLHR
jgi:ABC-type multidrug transport system ATPase subunit/ABC-type multidrug transport system permease subunit